MSPAVFDFDETFSFGKKKKRVCGSTRADFSITFLILVIVVGISIGRWDSKRKLENVNKIYLVAIVPIS